MRGWYDGLGTDGTDECGGLVFGLMETGGAVVGFVGVVGMTVGIGAGVAFVGKEIE